MTRPRAYEISSPFGNFKGTVRSIVTAYNNVIEITKGGRDLRTWVLTSGDWQKPMRALQKPLFSSSTRQGKRQ